MSDYDFSGLSDAIRQRFGESIARPIFARLGDPTRASGSNIDASPETGIPGTVYVHGRSDGADGVTVVRIKPELDRRVWTFGTPVSIQRENGELVIVGTNTIEANEYFDGVFIDTQNPITLSKIDIGLLQQTQPPSMQCYISPAIYDETYITGKLTADFSASPLDTSAVAIDVPTTNGKAIAVLIQLNVATGDLEYKQSAEFDVEISLQIAIEQGLVPTLDADRERIGWILLRHGVTALRNGVHIYPANSLFSGGGGGGGSMSSFSVGADSGTPETVEDGNTLIISGGTGIETAVSASDTVSVGISAGGVGTTELADDAVTIAKILDVAVGHGGEIFSNGVDSLYTMKSNLSATRAPTANDDGPSLSYSVGSLWIDTTNNNIYRCIDNSGLAAVWAHLNQSSGGRFVGELFYYAGNTAPANTMFCDGSAISRTTYADLFAVIGTKYGTGDGSTTFNLPDFRGRVVAGHDNMGGTDANRITSVAAHKDTPGYVGAETHTLTESEIPPHRHDALIPNSGLSPGPRLATSSGDRNYIPYYTSNTGGGQSHNNLQPTGFTNICIVYQE